MNVARHTQIFVLGVAPLAVALILLIHTTIVCLIRETIYRRFSFSYNLFIIIIGGILVLYIYIYNKPSL